MGKISKSNLGLTLTQTIELITPNSGVELQTESKQIIPAINEILSKLESGVLGGNGGGNSFNIAGSDIEKNFLDLLMIRELEGSSSGADAGYWWDLLLNDSTIRSFENTRHSREGGNYGQVNLTPTALNGSVLFNFHNIGFKSDAMKLYIDRDVSTLTQITSGVTSGSTELTVDDYVVTIKEI